MATNFNRIKCNRMEAIDKDILAYDMYFGERKLNSGLIILNDDMKDSGIRPRWCKIYEVGPNVDHLNVGQYIYVEHGRWSRGVDITDNEGDKTIRKIDPKDILLVSDEEPTDLTIGSLA